MLTRTSTRAVGVGGGGEGAVLVDRTGHWEGRGGEGGEGGEEGVFGRDVLVDVEQVRRVVPSLDRCEPFVGLPG